MTVHTTVKVSLERAQRREIEDKYVSYDSVPQAGVSFFFLSGGV
ncbi:MAG: hypothetical protein QXO86_02905 [Nitrososphaerota archaeon]